MKVRLNVATQPLESHRRFVAGSVVLAVVGLAALVLLSTSVFRTWRHNRGERATITQYQNQLVSMRGERQQLAAFFNSSKTKTVMDRAAFLNSLIDQRSFPWTKIFTDLEKVLPAGVRVVSIEPKMQNGQVDVKLVVGAANDKSKIQFLEALQKSPAFSGIRVNAETRATGDEGSDQVDVDLNAVYSGAKDTGVEAAPEQVKAAERARSSERPKTAVDP
jgi:type IV pilus assembly protein PilN